MKENVRIKDKWKKRNLIAHHSRVHVGNGSGSLSIHLPTRAERRTMETYSSEKTKWNSPSIASCSSPSPKACIIIFHIFGICFLDNKIYFHWVSRQPEALWNKQRYTTEREIEKNLGGAYFCSNFLLLFRRFLGKQTKRTNLAARRLDLKSHRFINFLGNQTGSNSKV